MFVDRAAKLLNAAIWVAAVSFLLAFFLPDGAAVGPGSPPVPVPASLSGSVKKIAPSVVHVYTVKSVEADDDFSAILSSLPHGLEQPETPLSQNRAHWRQEQSLGCGIVASTNGDILTNFHLVEDAETIEVVADDSDERLKGSLIGADPATDLAIIRVQRTNLRPATFGNSDRIEVGDVCLAVGNPFGVGQTVTMGIISATGRGGFGLTDYEDFIQTDAAINPGNSGGALVNADGDVIGISTAVLATMRGGQGLGFAVPANLAREVMQEIMRFGRVTRGSLGVSLQPVTADLARRFALGANAGALVSDVASNSPAAVAGIEPGDAIVGFNGQKVADPRHLRLLMGRMGPNTRVRLDIVHDGARHTAQLALAEAPRAEAVISAPAQTVASNADLLTGVTVTDLDAGSRKIVRARSQEQGALVASVDYNSLAYAAGMRAGDVIVEIDRRPVRSSDQAMEISRKILGRELLLRVLSEGNNHFVLLNGANRIPQPPLISSSQ